MEKIWKHSNGQILITSTKPGDDYTDETNIANFIGVVTKGIITQAEMYEYVDSYINNQKGEMSNYDVKWLKIYNDISR